MLDDLLADDLSLIICGSAVGLRSAERREYYAGRGNGFWRTLATVGLTPRELSPGEYRELLNFGIGLTDLVKGQTGSDRAIHFEAEGLDQFRAKIQRFRPRYLCFNGKRPAQEFLGRKSIAYGLQADRIGPTALYVAPSTSGAARAHWDLSYWRELADLVRRNVAV